MNCEGPVRPAPIAIESAIIGRSSTKKSRPKTKTLQYSVKKKHKKLED